MLSSLSVKNFAIVEQLDIDWQNGMTTITGETGAGKSIAIDALSLALGERAEADMVRHGADKAEICATFDIADNTAAQRWLNDNDLDQHQDCILRRVITANGRSRGYINGSPVPIQQMRAIGDVLVSIHGQHAHQLLTKPRVQRDFIDGYAAHPNKIDKVKKAYQHWRKLSIEFASLQESQSQRTARQQLIEYQVKELDEFAPTESEYVQIDAEQKKLSNGAGLLEQTQQHLNTLIDDEHHNAYSAIQQASFALSEYSDIDSNIANIVEQLNGAAIQLEEASTDMRRFAESFDLDPSRLAFIEERISGYIQLSRKHNISPDKLVALHQELAQELSSLTSDESRLEQMQADIDEAEHIYRIAAAELSSSRQKAANKLHKLISEKMQLLSMPHGKFIADVKLDKQQTPNSLGNDEIEFLVSTNPGQPAKPLAKVASGGELSRISLAIQVIIAEKVTTPTLIFDEVDVGISGPTAATVGGLLRQLGQATQVICVTHLPQVAASGHQQMFVDKISDGKRTSTSMLPLTQAQRVNEVARLLAGDIITASTTANAKELLRKSA